MESLSIGIDMDGVLYNWHAAVYDYFRFYKEYTGSYSKFWSEYYKTFSDEMWDYLTGVDIFYSSQQPTKECVNFLNSIKYKYDIYYITSRPNLVRTTTKQYLRKYNFPYKDNVIFTDDKANVSRLLQLTYCIDDMPHNVESLSKVTNVIMIAQPWNTELWEKYNTAHSLNGVLKYLEA